jgi:hypothetical protein
MALFRRVPILGALCGEVLICQCLSSLLSFMFMMCYKETLQADEERASYIGKVRFWKLVQQKSMRSLPILTEAVTLSHYLVLRVDQFCERCPAIWTNAGSNEAGRYQSRLDPYADNHVCRHGMGIPGRR